MRLIIANGTIVHGGGTYDADVLCQDGRIAGILSPGQPVAAVDERIDARGLLVFPGFIDPHVHSRDPGQTEKEDFGHSTLGALCGGITTVFEMPNAVPPVTDAAVFEDRAARHERVAATDFGLWGLALGTENVGELAGLYAAGAVGVKIFWGYALDRDLRRLVYNIGDYQPDQLIPPPDLAAVLEIVTEAARVGGLVAAHCEDRSVLEYAERRVGRVEGYADLLAARPALAEVTSVALAAQFAQATGCRFHVLHVSSEAALRTVQRAQQDGVDITAETCPHYLMLTQDSYSPEDNPTMKVYPPIRSPRDQEALWEGIVAGTIHSVGSDHAPHTPQEKAAPLASQPAGLHGIETMVPLMLDQMVRGRVTPECIARVLSENTARRYGISHRKGSVRVGADADFTLVDPHRDFRIDASSLHTKHRVSVFDGYRGRGVAVASVLRGEIAMRDGGPASSQRRGRLVRSAGSPAAQEPSRVLSGSR